MSSPASIGPYTLTSPLVLAPMAGVTDLPFRNLCRQMGAALAVSEMVSSDPQLWKSRKSRLRLTHGDELEPRAVQLLGTDPEQLALAARHNVAQGAQIIDINMGCPARKVCSKAAGAALMRDEPLVARILRAVVQAVEVPVTLKIRTGWDPAQRNALQIARIAEDSGIQALAIHGRTRADAYQGEAEYDTIAEVKQALGIPVLANGDIDSPEKARAVLEHTRADGLLIGRAAIGNPWLFQQIRRYLETGERQAAPSLETRFATLSEHLAALHRFYGAELGVRMARKHASRYLEQLPDAVGYLQGFNRLDTPQAQLDSLAHYLQQCRHRLTSDTPHFAA